MGLFSSKTRTQVYSTAVNLIENPPKDLITTTAMSALLRDEPLVDHLLVNQLEGLSSRMRLALQYGEQDYYYGLPEGYTSYSLLDTDALKGVLEGLLGQSVQILYGVRDAVNYDFMAYPFLLNQRGWDPATNTVSNAQFGPEAQHAFFTGASPASDTTLNLAYSYQTYDAFTETWTNHETTEEILVPYIWKASLYYQVVYQPLDGQGNPVGPEQYWCHPETLNTFPTLKLSDAPTLASPFYPIVPFRVDNTDLTDPTLSDTTQYRTSKRLVDLYGLDFASIGESLNSNPDVGEMDHAYLYIGVDLVSPEQVVIDYLYDFFQSLEGTSTFTQAHFQAWSPTDRNNPPPTNRVRIEDAGLAIELTYSYIDSTVKSGTIGAVGHTIRSLIISPPGEFTVTYQTGDESTATRTYYDWETSVLRFQRQVTPTTYIELDVVGLMHTNYVQGNYVVETTLANTQEDEKESFIIPLHSGIVEQYALPLQTDLFYHSFRLIINSVVVTKTKWYQTAFFRALVVVVSITISILNPVSPTSLGARLATFAKATGVAAVIIGKAINFAVGMLVTKGISAVVRHLGFKESFAILTAIAGYLVYSSINKGSLDLVPNGKTLLATMNAIGSGIQDALQVETRKLQGDWSAFLEESAAKQDELDSLWDALNTRSSLDTFNFIDPVISFNPDETPEAFYNRTIHSGNVGVYGYDLVHNYVDLALELPTTPSFSIT